MKRYDFFTFLERLTILQAQATAKAVALDQVAASLGRPPSGSSVQPVRSGGGDHGGSARAETATGKAGSDVRAVLANGQELR